MRTVHLAFKAFDCHELLCHAIAETAGMYAGHDLTVRLLDSTFLPDESLPENCLQAACGAALASFLAGASPKVVFVACDRPMFWLCGRRGVDTIAELARARVAGFPEAAPPAGILRKILCDAGVAPAVLPCRDDVARLGLLRSGAVDAAMLSSLHLPHEMESNGLRTLAFAGDYLRLPSTGLALSAALIAQEPELVTAMTAVYRQAIEAVFNDGGLLRKVLTETFCMPAQGIEHAVQTVRHCYNPLGFSDDSLLQSAIDGMARSIGADSRPAGDLYDFGILASLR